MKCKTERWGRRLLPAGGISAKALLTAFLLLFSLAVWGIWAAPPAGAASASSPVADEGNLFTEGEEQELEARILEAEKAMPFDLAVVTTNNTRGASAETYADDFYDNNGYGRGDKRSGALFLIDMDNREIYVSTSGDAILFLPDNRIEEILDAAYGSVSRGAYADAAFTFVGKVQSMVNRGIPGDQYTYDRETGTITRHYSLSFGEAAGAFLIALLAAGIPCLVILKKYGFKAGAYGYSGSGRLHLNCKEDVFLNKTVTARHIPPPSSSSHGSSGGSGGGGSRSTTHTSSSGRTHGGGGRKF